MEYKNLNFKYIHNNYFTCLGTNFQYYPVVLSALMKLNFSMKASVPFADKSNAFRISVHETLWIGVSVA